MPLTLPLPDWVPWWGQLVILVIAILFAIAFLMMPFAVFGLKGRLDFLEAQLDDIHAELRMLGMRLPDADRAVARSSAPVVQELAPPPGPAASRPPRPSSQSRPPDPASPGRGSRELDDWSREPSVPDEEDMPRRPLRARPPVRDADRGRPEPSRSEPTLRWPPR